MRSTPLGLLPVVMFGAIVATNIPAHAQLPPAHPGPTVNDYTAAEFRRAETAARAAGYSAFELTMVQDGNFFLRGDKAGQRFSLTVTPDGKVYPSAPLPAAEG